MRRTTCRLTNTSPALLSLALAATALLAADALAQAPGQPAGGRYFSTFWLLILVIHCVVWLGVFDWIGSDAERWRLNKQYWSGLAMAMGAAGTVVMGVLGMGFSFVTMLALGTLFGIYVRRRNRIVPEERKILTRKHIAFLFHSLAVKLKLSRADAAASERGGQAGAAEIILLRKDGATLENITDGSSSTRTSDAALSIKELIESAVLSRATDIHLEPKEDELQVRFRIDGILHSVPSYPPDLSAPMISSVKVISDMDIAERRKPQDGTFMGRLGRRTLDFRVSTTPSIHGETMVLRILDRDAGLLRLEKLGFGANDLPAMRRIISHPHGMLIVAGPTGSGKSTTLYAALSELDAFQKNILTIEDPIEYRLDNVTQTQVNLKTGVTFATQLRTMLRQDPDVILVGEIRDAETARVSLQAAMTGHFVMTTLHANDSITSIFRLLDLGVEAYLLSSSVTAILAQRLMRLLCNDCKEPYQAEPSFLVKIGVKSKRVIELYKPVGCDSCQGTGYRGRTGIFEMFELNDVAKDLIRTNPSKQLLQAEARKAGMKRLQEDGLAKVIKGYTSVKELVRVTR